MVLVKNRFQKFKGSKILGGLGPKGEAKNSGGASGDTGMPGGGLL